MDDPTFSLYGWKTSSANKHTRVAQRLSPGALASSMATTGRSVHKMRTPYEVSKRVDLPEHWHVDNEFDERIVNEMNKIDSQWLAKEKRNWARERSREGTKKRSFGKDL